MSTLKADGIIASTGTNTNLTLEGKGTGGVKITDYLVHTKGADIASATALALGKDGNAFDVTGTTTITSIGTQGIGSHVTLHFDGILTFTHHATDLILPGAANITTAVGDVAVMYEYASGDWRCVSYTKATGAPVVSAGGGWTFIETLTADTTTPLVFTHTVEANYDYLITFRNCKWTADPGTHVGIQVGTGAGPTFQTSGYTSQNIFADSTSVSADRITPGMLITASGGVTVGGTGAGETQSGRIEMYDPGANAETDSFAHNQGDSAANAFASWQHVSRRTTAEIVTAFRLNQTTSNMATGTLKLFRRPIT